MTSKTLSIPGVLEELVDIYRNDPIRSISLLINQGALDGTNKLTEVLRNTLNSNEKALHGRVGVYSEYLSLYTHLINRMVYNEVGDNSVMVMKAFFPQVLEVACHNIFELGKHLKVDEIKQYLVDNYNEAENAYAETTSYAGKDYRDPTSTANIFRWRILAHFGKELSIDKELKIVTQMDERYFLTLIDLAEWVKGPVAQLGLKQYDAVNLINNERIDRLMKEIKG